MYTDSLITEMGQDKMTLCLAEYYSGSLLFANQSIIAACFVFFCVWINRGRMVEFLFVILSNKLMVLGTATKSLYFTAHKQRNLQRVDKEP